MSFHGQWRRYGCCPFDEDDIPGPTQNLVIFEMTGYNYRAIPEWFDAAGQKLIPLQFSVLYSKLYYRWTFYKSRPTALQDGFLLSTSDDIFPTIVEFVTKKRMHVQRLGRHNGYTRWLITG